MPNHYVYRLLSSWKWTSSFINQVKRDFFYSPASSGILIWKNKNIFQNTVVYPYLQLKMNLNFPADNQLGNETR